MLHKRFFRFAGRFGRRAAKKRCNGRAGGGDARFRQAQLYSAASYTSMNRL
jgi:hypothetical protein